ncbi:MAG: cyclic nucleotide-binding domain-containing protein [Chloroflexota bacterium]|nr:cyclic nucleotide-binding domain-containing protein [Chloroflexota bacterium]
MTAEQLQSELAQVQVLRHLTYPALRRIVQTGRLVEAKNGQLVIGPGFGSRGFFVVLSGSVSVQMPNGVILGYLGPKQYFGEIALLEGVDRTAACRANADSVLFEIPPQTFHADLASNPMVKAGMLATVKLRRMVQEKVKSASAAGIGPGAQPRPAVPAAPGAVPRPTVPGAPGLAPRPTMPPIPGAVPRPAIPGIPARPPALPPRPAPVFASA